MPQLSPEAWTALATWVLVVGTLAAVWYQVRIQRRLHSVDVVINFSRRFDSMAMKGSRQNVAKWLLEGPPEATEASQMLLNFFDEVGYLTKSGVLDAEAVWFEFCWPVTHYYHALEGHVASLRREDQDHTLHDEFDWLHRRLCTIDCKKRGMSKEWVPGKRQLQDFLHAESQLGQTGGSATPPPPAAAGGE